VAIVAMWRPRRGTARAQPPSRHRGRGVSVRVGGVARKIPRGAAQAPGPVTRQQALPGMGPRRVANRDKLKRAQGGAGPGSGTDSVADMDRQYSHTNAYLDREDSE
jgi:hypothetical protein